MAGAHTPTPWRVCADPQFSSEIETVDGSLSVAMAHAKGHELLPDCCEAPDDDVSDANAAFIVRAVNAHDELVAALRQARTDLEEAGNIIGGHGYPGTAGIFRGAAERIEAILAKAEAQS